MLQPLKTTVWICLGCGILASAMALSLVRYCATWDPSVKRRGPGLLTLSCLQIFACTVNQGMPERLILSNACMSRDSKCNACASKGPKGNACMGKDPEGSHLLNNRRISFNDEISKLAG